MEKPRERIEITAPAPDDVAGAVQSLAPVLQDAIAQYGLDNTRQDGAHTRVQFRTVQWRRFDQRAWGLYEVDMQRLPRGVTADALVSSRLTHHLSSVCGHKVVRANSTGVTYVVQLHRERAVKNRAQLPRIVALDLGARPAEGLHMPLGVSNDGSVWARVLRSGHYLIIGTTQSGKTSLQHAMRIGLCASYEPAQVKLALIDGKSNESMIWRGVPHLLAPVATSSEQGALLCETLIEEMERREALFADRFVRNIEDYNASAPDPLPVIVLMIDEFVDLMTAAGPRSIFVAHIKRLASRGAASGITLILSATNAKAEVIDTTIRTNCPNRIAFHIAEPGELRALMHVAADVGAPANHPGRMLVKLTHHQEPIEVQGYFVSTEMLQSAVRFLSRAERRLQTARAFDADTMAIIDVAVNHLDGKFVVGAIYEALGRRIPKNVINDIARRLQSKGLLSPPAHAADSRKVTPELVSRWRAAPQQMVQSESAHNMMTQ